MGEEEASAEREWYRRRDCGVHGDDYGRGESERGDGEYRVRRYAWKTPEEVISGEEYHPALKNAVKAMFFNMRQNDLIAAVREGKSDGEIAKLAREAFAEK